MAGESTSFHAWISRIQALTNPDKVHIVNGTKEEEEALLRLLQEKGTLFPLNEKKRPHSFLAWSNPEDVARVEDKTFICTRNKIDAGPTNNWLDPVQMKQRLQSLFSGCMRGRTMYVVPYCMGPIDSPYARFGVEITDSPYVVLNLRIMSRVNQQVLDKITSVPFVPCIHSVGVPLVDGKKDCSWPCNTKDLVIAHFPEDLEIWSFGSGYGGNALLSKKCFALRIASWMAKSEGWLAEHMLIVGVTNPAGKKRYITASFPSACGKTNLAMLQSTLPGWKVECVGDDIAWMFWDEQGVLRAINPEFGFFGVAPGTSTKTNLSAIKSISKNSIFTNVGKTEDGDVWWEGMTETAPNNMTTWKKEPYAPGLLAAHPNARFTAPITQCPVLDPAWNDPDGVPISAMFFGGRRASTVPLIREANSWSQGVLFGASMTSETTAAAKGAVGQVRHDPFAMLPFCGYNMGDYFHHWLSMEKPGRQMPKIFYVNWFLKDKNNAFVWPGFGENIRALAWACDRIDGRAGAQNTPVGLVPDEQSFQLPSGCSYQELFPLDIKAWKAEIQNLREYFSKFEQTLPQKLVEELSTIEQRLEQPKGIP
jgi:phosphoenolpyruvate carboxykinase (GTP)